MRTNNKIWAVTGDLGYGGFDKIMRDYPDRFINTFAAEQAMLDISVGLAYEGKIPICYSITPFLIYRPFETIRTYINHEKLNIKLVGSGRDSDYLIDGISHNASDVSHVLKSLHNIRTLWPSDKKDISSMAAMMIDSYYPYFLSLRR